MKIFAAALMTETNGFSAIPCARASFDNAMFLRPEPSGPQPDPATYEQFGYRVFLRLARERGYEAAASLHAFAEPAAPCHAQDYEALRDEILGDLARAMPVDMVFLMLHGAMMAQGYDDCEGDILARVRAIVGPDVFIGVELDLHGNVSAKMASAADAMLACLLYPHTDFDERAERLFAIGERFVRGEIRAANHIQRVPILGLSYTTLPRMAAVVDALRAIEQQDGIHAVSLMHGFPWADHSDVGAAVVIVAEPGHADVPDLARALGRAFFAVRDETRALRQPIDTLLDTIDASADPGPFVIADVADNAGGGAGADSTFLLRRLIERGVQDAALAMIWDPIAVDFAYAAGIGNRLALRLGGKTGPTAGLPIDGEATVIALADAIEQEDPAGGLMFPIGRAALLRFDGVLVVVNSLRQQVYDPKCFTALGVDLAALRVVVVKSTQHFHEYFAPLATRVFYCETPGALTLDFDPKNYARLRRPVWPIDADATPD
jgi:microcystin degradation protein MlrC